MTFGFGDLKKGNAIELEANLILLLIMKRIKCRKGPL